ncbi:Triple gene block 2 protein [Shallot virus S]|uniref:Movement protein TGB2 n=1 Tax=Shallot virus S TaxID=2586033 RepID=A0AAE6FPT2_9VIRU|nr:Triple gene block 2 protein [Shallot virus S]QCY49484.1 Triple gene block 2 protein [Shallot virus S]
MPLSPPPNYTTSVLAGIIGVGTALVLFTLTRSTLPHTGDNIHHLPHGGCYQDGTKRIFYNSPSRTFPSSNLFSNVSLPFCGVLVLTALILFCEKFGLGSKLKVTCCHNHS